MKLSAHLRTLPRFVIRILWGFLVGWLIDFLRALVAWLRKLLLYCRSRDKGPREPHHRCIPIPPEIYQRPDPYLYSQQYLTSLGIAVTWDNPDIWLERAGVAVDSYSLDPDTDYTVVIQVWNGSFVAPAPGLKVEMVARTFGVGGGVTPVGTTLVDLPVRGAPGHPAIARIPWHTPDSGHHCLEATLVWPDDANALNNVGQENTDIRQAQPGHKATFAFPVSNPRHEPASLRLLLSGYELPAAPIERTGKPLARIYSTAQPRLRSFSRPGRATNEAVDRVIAVNPINGFPADDAWLPTLSEGELRLAPGEARVVEAVFTVPPTAARGDRKPFTLRAVDGRGESIGGVTLVVEVE